MTWRTSAPRACRSWATWYWRRCPRSSSAWRRSLSEIARRRGHLQRGHLTFQREQRQLLVGQQLGDALPLLLAQQIELGVHGGNLHLGAHVHLVVVARVGSVLRALAILAH